MEDITEAARGEERERVVFEFSQRIASNIDLGYRLRAVCETAVEFGYRMAWVGLFDAGARTLTPMARSGRDDGFIDFLKEVYWDTPFGDIPCEEAVDGRRAVVRERIVRGTGDPWAEEAARRGYGSMVSLPVLDEDGVLGVLCVYSEREDFPPREVDFLQTFASQAGVYIKNASLFEAVKDLAERLSQEADFNKNLLKIAEATSQTIDRGRLMQQVSEDVRNITGAAAVLTYRFDPKTDRLHPSEAAGLSPETAPLFRAESLDPEDPTVAGALDEGVPVMKRAGSVLPGEDDLFEALMGRFVSGLNSLALVPLKGREGRLGLVVCLYGGGETAAPFFSVRDVQLMRGISRQVSVALDEARLYKESIDRTIELSRKVETIQIMHEIDRSILSTLEPGEILETAALMVGRLVPCDRATIALYDNDRDAFTYAAGFGLESLAKGAVLPAGETTATDVVKTGRLQYIPNLEREGAVRPFEKQLLAEGFLSHLRVPLTVKGETIGVLTVGSTHPAAYSSEDLSVIEKLASQISVAFENSRLLTDREELFLGVVKTLSEAIDAKSPWTRGHSDRVTRIALEIGRQAGFSEDELKVLKLAGLLHDIGKLGTYESILDKTGRLTEEERGIMMRHPSKGADILAPIKQMQNIVPAIRHHHEFYDGTGYPDGLAGDDIPFMARILTVADTVDAMSADRPYRKGKPMDVITAELRRCSGTQFDPAVVEAFFKTSLVRAA